MNKRTAKDMMTFKKTLQTMGVMATPQTPMDAMKGAIDREDMKRKMKKK